MAYRIGPTPQLSQPRSNSAEDVRGLALQVFKDSIDLRSRLILAFPKDGSEAMEAPLPLQLVETVDLPSPVGLEGAIVYDGTLGQLLWSDGANWLVVANEADVFAQKPSFSAHKNGTDQTYTSAGVTQITFGTELYDVGADFASSVWTPPAGLVTLSASLIATGDMNLGFTHRMSITKNGATTVFKQTFGVTGDDAHVGLMITIHDRANGTDVYGVAADISVSTGDVTVLGSASETWFMGSWIGE